MATLNVAMKFGGAVAAVSTGTGGTLYTVPANSYFHIWRWEVSAGQIFASVNCSIALGFLGSFGSSGTSGASVAYNPLLNQVSVTGASPITYSNCLPLILPAGQSITFSRNGTSGGASVYGYLISNTQ